MAELPSSLRIGHFDFALLQKKRHEMPADSAYGQTDFRALEIWLGIEEHRQQIFDTVIHEISHAIIYTRALRGFFDDAKHEENFILAMTGGLVDVLRSNPALVAWLAAELRG